MGKWQYKFDFAACRFDFVLNGILYGYEPVSDSGGQRRTRSSKSLFLSNSARKKATVSLLARGSGIARVVSEQSGLKSIKYLAKHELYGGRGE